MSYGGEPQERRGMVESVPDSQSFGETKEIGLYHEGVVFDREGWVS